MERQSLQAYYSDGADEGTRTPNLLITNQLLYQLSYVSTLAKLPESSTIISVVR